jgi:peroxiredoxin
MNMKVYIKRILIVIGAIVIMFFVLHFAGNIFIKEIVQNVAPKTYENKNTAVELDKEAPFFELPDLSGNKVKLSDYLGSPLVITFWAAWNQTSADQIGILDDILSKNKSMLFKVITVNNQEDKSAVQSFVKRGGYKLNVLLDEKGAIGELYQAINLPVSYFLDKDGAIKDIFVGVLNEKMLIDKSEAIIH